jgi:5-methylcytosine-specific restriction endonuclease McrA
MNLNFLPSVINDDVTKDAVREWTSGTIKLMHVVIKVAKNIEIRCRLGEAQNWKCCWCGVECVPEPKHKNSATIEHVHPRSLGGENSWDNYAMACSNCNSRRGTLSVEEFTANLLRGGPTPKQYNGPSKQSKKMKRSRARLAKHIRGGLKLAARGWVNAAGEEMCIEGWIATLKLNPANDAKLRAGVFETS